MPSYSLADPPVLAFVLLPAALAIVFVWGVAAAWRRTGQPARAGQAALRAAAGTLIWMGVTFAVADRGVLLDWHRTPPPFALLVVSIVTLAMAIASARSVRGWRNYRSGHSSPCRRSVCRSRSRCTLW